MIMGATKRKNYEQRVHKMLQDEKTYEVLKTDPTPKYKRKLMYILSKLKKIPFLDTLIICKPNGAIKLLVCRKPTHTDQYLNFMSALHQKMGVIRTLFDRMNSVITEEAEKLIEEEGIRQS